MARQPLATDSAEKPATNHAQASAREIALRYGVALTSVGAAIVIRRLLDPVLGAVGSYATLFIAVLYSAWVCGFGPAALAAVVGGFAALWFVVQPRYSLMFSGAESALSLALYLATSLGIAYLGGRMRLAIERAEKSALDRDDQRERLRVTLQGIGDGVIATDARGRIASMNQVAVELTGYSVEEALGQPLDEVFRVVSGETREPVLNPVAEVLAEERFVSLSGHTLLIDKQAKLRPIDDSAAPIRNEKGEIEGVILVFRDISRRRDAEEALRLSGTRLRLLWESAKVLLTNDDSRSMLAALFALIAPYFGMDLYFNYLVADDADTLTLESFAGVSDDCAATIRNVKFGQGVSGSAALERRSIYAPGVQDSNDELSGFMRSNGVRFYVCNPLIIEGRLLGTLTIASRSRDSISEDEMGFLATICHYVTLAYDRLRLTKELRQSDSRKDAFMATLAHELRNPLAPVRSSLEIVKRAKSDPALCETAWSVIDRQMLHLERLVDDLLEISRIRQDKLELRRSRVELGAAIRQAVEICSPLAEASSHRLTVSMPIDPIRLDADPARLVQIFGNLLNNACKYTEPGGMIEVSAQRLGDNVIVSVHDNGAGIEPELLPRVFEMFEQIGQASGNAQGGLGIGLTLVRRLVEMHGGRIEAFSDGLGTGSEFVVQLPLSTDAPAPAPVESVERPAPVSKRILVVDDNRDAAQMLANLLALDGHQVHLAHDGSEAVAAAEVFHPDIVLLDLGLPRMDGCEAARKIREQPWSNGMILIALTGWGQEDDRRKTEAAGFNYHLVKPVDIDSLTRLLGECDHPSSEMKP